MKYSFLLNCLRPLCLLCVMLLLGSGNVWGETVTYTIDSKTSVITKGTAPSGSLATYSQTYSDMGKMTKDNSTTLTLSGFAGMKITSIVLNMHSNTTGSSGTFSAKGGTTTLAEISDATPWSKWYGERTLTANWTDVIVTMKNANYEIGKDENVLIYIAATSNSLYINSYTITYEEVQHFTVSWLVNGETYTEGNPTIDVQSGCKVSTLPTNPTSPDYKSTAFVGWTESTISSKQAVAPDVLFDTAEEAPVVTSNVTYRAVFAKATQGEPTFKSYNEVTIAPSDWSGTYVMVASESLVEIDGSKTTSMKASTVFVSTTEKTDAEVTIAKTEYGYSIKLSNSNYLGKKTTDNTDLAIDATYSASAFDWQLSTTGINSCYYASRYLMASSSGSVSAYKPSSSYYYVRLYKKTMTDGMTYSDYFTDIATLQSLAISGTPNKTLYNNGESFDPTGLTVTGTFSDNSTKVITDDVTWENKTVSAENVQNFTIQASIGNITADYTINDLRIKYFYESFDTNSGTGGNDDKWSGSIASSNITSDNYGWEFTEGKGADKCAKFGIGSKKGSAQTPTITMTGAAKITFKAGAWKDDATKLNLSTTSGTLSQSSVTMENEKWTEYTVYITGVTESTQIKFESANTSNNRFFLDEVLVTTLGTENATMTCKAGKLGTFCAPFDVTLPGDVKAYSAALNGDNTKVNLTKIASAGETLDAGTPAIIYSEAGLDETVLNGTATFFSPTCTSDCLTGNLTTNILPEGCYILQTQHDTQAFYKVATAGTGALNRCYLTGVSSSAKLNFEFDDASDIEETSLSPALSTSEGVYNLQGMKVNENYKGVVIKNGKKFLMK